MADAQHEQARHLAQIARELGSLNKTLLAVNANIVEVVRALKPIQLPTVDEGHSIGYRHTQPTTLGDEDKNGD